jgi:hypothetical protein
MEPSYHLLIKVRTYVDARRRALSATAWLILPGLWFIGFAVTGGGGSISTGLALLALLLMFALLFFMILWLRCRRTFRRSLTNPNATIDLKVPTRPAWIDGIALLNLAGALFLIGMSDRDAIAGRGTQDLCKFFAALVLILALAQRVVFMLGGRARDEWDTQLQELRPGIHLVSNAAVEALATTGMITDDPEEETGAEISDESVTSGKLEEKPIV